MNKEECFIHMAIVNTLYQILKSLKEYHIIFTSNIFQVAII